MENSYHPEYKVKTTKTVFRIVETVQSLGGATLTEIADQFELATSTIHNHLTTLEQLGYVTKEDNEYFLSMRFLSIGEYVQYRRPEFKHIEEKISELADKTGERASFAIPENSFASCVFTEGGSSAVKLRIRPGDPLFLHCTALGKAILATKPKEEVAQIIAQRGMKELTSNTITEKEKLLDELENIRETGVAYSKEESVMGMNAIGFPISPSSTTPILGAISISGPTRRMDDQRIKNEIQDLVLGTVNEIEINIERSSRET